MNRQRQKTTSRKPDTIEGPFPERAHPIPQGQIVERRQTFEGPVPHPEIMRGYEELVPGTAARMLAHAEEEARHRRELELKTTEANIRAQQKALEIEGNKTSGIIRSDTLGQVAGVIVSLSCIGGAIYLGSAGHTAAAAVLGAIPSAAVIQAFFAKKTTARPPPK